LIVLISTAGLAHSYCPDPHPSLEKEFASSAVVFVGTVLSERSTIESDGFYDGTTYTLQVEEIFRGMAGQTIDIFSENSSERFPMTVGSRYIVFGYSQGGRIQIDYCGHTGVLPEKSSILKKLRELKASEQWEKK
jgi:hypothetical protein